MTESKKVTNKILDKIIEDVKFIFEGLSTRDEEIIRENFIIKQDSWNQLGQGVKNIIDMVTPINFSIFQEELIKALRNDMKPSEKEK